MPKLIDILLHDPRPELRGTAAWALSQIGGMEAGEAIGRALDAEQEEEVRVRLRTAEQKLQASIGD
ncbi:hypothetical protein D3C81_2034890 [compost metagenome]